MIGSEGWRTNCIWEHSEIVRDLYSKRARGEVAEMTCAAQGAELLAQNVAPGDTLLDAGCGSGYFFHSLKKRKIPVQYFGIDASRLLIEIGRRELPKHGLSEEHLRVQRIEDLSGTVDHVICMNVLSNIDNYHRPLERLLKMARKSLILRESCAETKLAGYRYVRDEYLDEGCDLNVYVNTYDIDEVKEFTESYGFRARQVTDRRTGGAPEMVIGYPHYWTFIAAERI